MNEKEQAICEQMLKRISDAVPANRLDAIQEYQIFLQAVQLRMAVDMAGGQGDGSSGP